ncbi:MAG: DUF3604 domain-containing protein [Eubacteriales bacterium]|nr:DUF3604 domain-containing protein [Eubacteriales bacterium]
MILTNEYLGTVKMSNIDHVVAGVVDTWQIDYTVGKYGIDDTGSIKVAWRNPSDWEMPQFKNPKEKGYTTVKVSGNAKIDTEYEMFERPFNQSIVIKVFDGFLVEGDIITIIFGDKSEGSAGMRAQTFCEEEHEFRVFIDPYGSRRYKRIPNDIVFPIYSGDAFEIHAVAPSVYDDSKSNEVLIRAIDYYGNIATDFKDEIEVNLISAREDIGFENRKISMKKSDMGLKRFTWNEKLEEGVYYFIVKSVDTKLTHISNPMIVSAEGKKLYFGDMHGQTEHTVGTGSLDRYFTFGRDSAFIDFSGWQGNDFQINNEKWNAVREATKKYNSPGEFVVFLGYEWSGLTQNGGDHNVYFFNDNETFYPNSNWLETPSSIDIDNNAPTIKNLLDKLKGREKEVMIIPHIGGRYATLDYHDLNFSPVIEVHSHHGTFEWFIFDAMKARKKVGFIATSDDHTCRPGMSYPLSKDGKASSFDVTSGYTAVYSDSLSKRDIWDAIHARKCYATTFNRMIVNTKIDKYSMGDDIGLCQASDMSVSVHSNSPIDTIELYNWDEKIGHKNLREKSSNKIRIAWSGVRVRTRKKSTNWDGTITVINGQILSASEYAFDRRDQGIKEKTDTYIRWTSNTSGDYDGLILDLKFDEKTEIIFESNNKNITFKPCEVDENLMVYPAGGENLKVEISLANNLCDSMTEFIEACNVEYTFNHMKKNKGEGNAYWVRVLQEDGHMAWTSPIFTE